MKQYASINRQISKKKELKRWTKQLGNNITQPTNNPPPPQAGIPPFLRCMLRTLPPAGRSGSPQRPLPWTGPCSSCSCCSPPRPSVPGLSRHRFGTTTAELTDGQRPPSPDVCGATQKLVNERTKTIQYLKHDMEMGLGDAPFFRSPLKYSHPKVFGSSRAEENTARTPFVRPSVRPERLGPGVRESRSLGIEKNLGGKLREI